MTESELQVGLVWNMEAVQFEQYRSWMQWCPWYFLTTAQRQLVQFN